MKNVRFSLMLTALLVGCVASEAPPEEAASDDLPRMGGAADGWNWDTSAGTDGTTDRLLEPVAVALDGSSHDGTFSADRYEAYTFDVEEAVTIEADFSWSFAASLDNGWYDAWNIEEPYRASLALFRKDEGATSDDPFEVWDLVFNTNDPVGTVSNGSAPSLEYEVYSPGTFLILVLASPDAYDDAQSYSLTVGSVDGDITARAPGNVQLTLATDRGTPAAYLRAAIGTSEGITDADGRLLLEGVEAGVHAIKLGPDGTGRPLLTTALFVHGDGATRHAPAYVDHDQYVAWLNAAAAE